MDNTAFLRLQDGWRQAQRHHHHMFHALDALESLLPLDEQRFVAMTDDEVQDVDQFVFRFSKLQDVIGARVFPALLDYLEEPYRERPMLDKLNRLEQLGYLTSVDEWQYFREIRNRFTHDYPDDAERNAVNLNLATAAAFDLSKMLSVLQDRLKIDRAELELAEIDAR